MGKDQLYKRNGAEAENEIETKANKIVETNSMLALHRMYNNNCLTEINRTLSAHLPKMSEHYRSLPIMIVCKDIEKLSSTLVRLHIPIPNFERGDSVIISPVVGPERCMFPIDHSHEPLAIH